MPPLVIDRVATITIDASGNISVSPDPFSTAPDKHIVFVIVNNHGEKHKVHVSPSNLKKLGKPTDPDAPIHQLGKFSDDVDRDDVGVFSMHVKDKNHFGPPGTYPYKYTIEVSGLPDKDPEIDINN